MRDYTVPDKALPEAVLNLRRIWNEKKHELKINQRDAAQALGWTQGAFSQYLNNITSLNPSAVLKLANFFDIDPLEIEPNLYDKTRERDLRVLDSLKELTFTFPSEKAVAVQLERNYSPNLMGRQWKLPAQAVLMCEPVGTIPGGPWMYKDKDSGEWIFTDEKGSWGRRKAYCLHSIMIDLSNIKKK